MIVASLLIIWGLHTSSKLPMLVVMRTHELTCYPCSVYRRRFSDPAVKQGARMIAAYPEQANHIVRLVCTKQ